MNAIFNDPPVTIVTATIWVYWACIGFMIVRARRHRNDLAGLVPEQRFERVMWLLMVPLVVAWIVLPYLALTHTERLLAVPDIAKDEPVYSGLRWVAAIVGVISLVVTMLCWRRMGKDWRMDVSERRQGELITDGLFAHVRHPIYALSMTLMVCTVIVVPTALMLAMAVLHIVLFSLKARNEERHLLAAHGDAYARYLARTGRFAPRRRAAK